MNGLQNCDVADADVGKKKRSNPSLDKKRSVAGLEKAVTKMIEICGIPMIVGFLNPNINKLEIFGDEKSVKALSEELKVSLDKVLQDSFRTGEAKRFFNIKDMKSSNFTENLSSHDKITNCHLPRPDFRILSQKEKFSSMITLLTSEKHLHQCLRQRGLGVVQLFPVENMANPSSGLSGTLMLWRNNVVGP